MHYQCANPSCNLYGKVVSETLARRAALCCESCGTAMACMKNKGCGTEQVGKGATCIEFSPDGQHLLSGHLDGTLGKWDASKGCLITKHRIHEGAIYSISFAHDGKRFVTASQDGTSRVLDSDSMTELMRITKDAEDGKKPIRLDATKQAKNAGPAIAADWKQSTRQVVQKLGLECCDLSKVQLCILSVNPIHVCHYEKSNELAIDAKLLPLIHGFGKDDPPIADVFNIAVRVAESVRPDVTCKIDEEHSSPYNIDASLRVPLANGTPDQELLARYIRDLNLIQHKFSTFLNGSMTEEEKDRIFTSHEAKDIRDEVNLLEANDAVENYFAICDACFSPDGQLIATAAGDGSVQLWNATTGESVATLGNHADKPALCLAFSRDGQTIVSGGSDGMLRLWDVETRTCIKKFSKEGGSIVDVAFHWLPATPVIFYQQTWENTQTAGCWMPQLEDKHVFLPYDLLDIDAIARNRATAPVFVASMTNGHDRDNLCCRDILISESSIPIRFDCEKTIASYPVTVSLGVLRPITTHPGGREWAIIDNDGCVKMLVLENYSHWTDDPQFKAQLKSL